MSEELPAGYVIDCYTIDSVLGRGGFGITYLAVENDTGNPVAIKEYYPRASAVRDTDGSVWINSPENEDSFNKGLTRFFEEAETLLRFHHPNIVRVLRRFRGVGTSYIVLEYIDGVSLEAWAQQAKRPPTQEQLEVFMAALVDALGVMHRNNFLHRDLAPKNILLRDGLPVLIDFGSARAVSPSKIMTAMVTPSYAPYEQYMTSGQGQGAWTDIYGASACIYRVLIGRPPEAATVRALDDTQHVLLADRFKGRYRRQFLEALDWGLRVHAKDRPQSVAEWRGPLLDGMSVAKTPRGLDTQFALESEEHTRFIDRMRRLRRTMFNTGSTES